MLTTLMSLPPELREHIYEHIALSHSTRHIKLNPTIPRPTGPQYRYKTSTSAVIATCRLIRHEYEAVARQTLTKLEFEVCDMDFRPVICYFQHHVSDEDLRCLRCNHATIQIDLTLRHFAWDTSRVSTAEFQAWLIFLLGTDLPATYHADDHGTWLAIMHGTEYAVMKEQCTVLDARLPPAIRARRDEVRRLATAFDLAMWRAYPAFKEELLDRRYAKAGLGRRPGRDEGDLSAVTRRLISSSAAPSTALLGSPPAASTSPASTSSDPWAGGGSAL